MILNFLLKSQSYSFFKQYFLQDHILKMICVRLINFFKIVGMHNYDKLIFNNVIYIFNKKILKISKNNALNLFNTYILFIFVCMVYLSSQIIIS